MRTIGSFGLAAVLLALAGMSTAVDTFAQELSSGEGVVVRPHWPDMVYEADGAMHDPDLRAAESFTDTELLPFLDTLAVSYAYSVVDDRPQIDFTLRWVPGDRGILDGRPVAAEALPDSIELTLIDLTAKVFVGPDQVGTLLLTLDSLAAPASPSVYAFATADVSWDGVFADMSEAATREAFERGFELRELDVLRIGFESFEPEFEPEPVVEDRTRDVPVARRQPRRRTVYVPNVDIWIGWDIGPDPYGTGPRRHSGTYAPRGDRMGRTEARPERRARGGTRTATESGKTAEPSAESAPAGRASRAAAALGKAGKKKDDKKDDDNDRDLLGPALGAVAAIGALAYFGGTVGYYGVPTRAPIGLQAGRVSARGGFLLHAAVSPDVLQGGSDERFMVGLDVIWRPLIGRIHPTAGFDVWIEDDGTVRSGEPTVTVGALARVAGPLVLNLGLDLVNQRAQFGVAFNFRWKDLAQ